MIDGRVGIHLKHAGHEELLILARNIYLGQLSAYILLKSCLIIRCISVGMLIIAIQFVEGYEVVGIESIIGMYAFVYMLCHGCKHLTLGHVGTESVEE